MSVTAAAGFAAAGVASGIKATGEPDLALVAADPTGPVAASAVFTVSKAAAAPVLLSRRHLSSSGGRVGAVILNSGGANAATGEQGMAAARLMAEVTAAELGLAHETVLVCSTGLIGTQLPTGPISTGVPKVVSDRAATAEAGESAAVAIMTTDTRPKQAVAHHEGFTVGGMCKGAGMIAPNMATMLAVLTTDAEASPEELDAVLHGAVAKSFNAISVDGCTSTNDTVVLLASGRRGAPPAGALGVAVSEVCRQLARQIVADAEGGTKVVSVVVTGAPDDAAAELVARAIADSNLVKCSWFGADPNWGRVVSAAASCGAPFDSDLVSVAYGGITVCAGGTAAEHDAPAVLAHLAGQEIELRCDLGLGSGTGELLSADLTHGYVDENAGSS